jgi:hypothetical protein
MIKRYIINNIQEALSDTPVVLVSGARQTGKSTLTRKDFAALKDFSEGMGDAFHRGIILYTGSEPVSFGKNLHALPVSTLWK